MKIPHVARLAVVAAVVAGAFFGVRAIHATQGGGRPARAEQPLLAVSVLNAAAAANEIELISGTGRRFRIDPHPPLPMDGAWSPDGKEIAFSGRGDNRARGIYLTNAQGTKVRLLYEPATPSHENFQPYWSPDGRKLAFVVDGLGPWVVAAAGGRPRRLADLPIDSYTTPIAWSPDGRALAFGSSRDGALYTIRTDGTNLRRLTRKVSSDAFGDMEEVGSAAWSPDGRRIAFVQYPVNVRPARIRVVSASGGRARPLARGDYPAWSPDGRQLAYIAGAGIGLVGAGGGLRVSSTLPAPRARPRGRPTAAESCSAPGPAGASTSPTRNAPPCATRRAQNECAYASYP